MKMFISKLGLTKTNYQSAFPFQGLKKLCKVRGGGGWGGYLGETFNFLRKNKQMLPNLYLEKSLFQFFKNEFYWTIFHT